MSRREKILRLVNKALNVIIVIIKIWLVIEIIILGILMIFVLGGKICITL